MAEIVECTSSRLGLSYAPEGGLMSMMYGGGKLAEGLTKLWCKMKLSSYLALDFCTLVSSEDDVFQLAQLASKVVKDPKLTVDQLEKLLVKSSILEDAQKSKAKLNYRLVSTTNSIPSLVEEIQLGFSRRAKWEMDKGKHAKVAADIEDRFFKLKGLTF
ncbi:hypothetical protein JHK87_033988 [Glycine soja]|nr:hypothetical protein JHK87_033988 [Glycine soja]